MKKSLLFFVLLITSTAFGQRMSIKGTVIDTNLNQSVRNALVMTIRASDSVLLDFTRTDKMGNFSISVPIDTVQVIITHPDYAKYTSYFVGSETNKDFEINPLVLNDKTTSLGEVVIYANKNPIYYRGDTLVYVADSFKLKENAVVEDLIKKLPGMNIDKDGKITSQGKEINQVLVDGDEFFGSDQTIATKNLAAKGVETVEVYEKDSEDGSDEKIQVLDLKLKDEAKKGYFGKISGGTDFANFYEGELLLNRFNKNQKIAVFALGSNTPKSAFSGRDLYKFGVSDGFNFFDESDDPSDGQSSGSVNTDNGIPQTFRAGFYLDQKVWKGGKFRLNYTYADNIINSSNESRSQYFLTDTSYTTGVIATKFEHYKTHEIGLKFTQQLDSLTKLEIEPKFTLNNTIQRTLSQTDFISARDTLTRYTNLSNESEAMGTNFGGTVRLKKDFKKRNRKLLLRYNLANTDDQSDGFLNSTDTDATTQTLNYSFDQKKENRSKSLANTGYANFVEPIAKSKRWKTEFDYEYYTNNSDQRKSTLNPLNGAYTELDTTYSNEFATVRQQNRAGAFLIYENSKARLSFGTRVRNIGINNNNLVTDTLIRQDLTNVLPRVTLTYKFSSSNRLRVTYNTNSSLPTINQLQPTRDNSNPNFLQIGNAELKPNYSHTVNLNYNMWRGLSGFYIYSGLNYTYQKDAFSTSTIYNPFGGTISQSINVDNASYLYFYGGTGLPIPKLKDTRLEFNANGNYTSTENYINLAKNVSQNAGVGVDLEISYNGDSLSGGIGGGFDYNHPSNSLSTASSQPYTNYNLEANVDWTLPLRLFVKSDITYTINTGRTGGYNINYAIWNASLLRSFLKTGNLYVGIEGYDLLGQNISAYRDVSDNVITDNKNKVITRYFLAKVILKFNNNHITEKEDDGYF